MPIEVYSSKKRVSTEHNATKGIQQGKRPCLLANSVGMISAIYYNFLRLMDVPSERSI